MQNDSFYTEVELKNKSPMNVLIISDNEYLCEKFIEIISFHSLVNVNFTFCYSSKNKNFKIKKEGLYNFSPIDIKLEKNDIINKYNLIISLHCKQIFPKDLLNKMKCINVHPGFNPYNRGFFPQVFSIINKKPCGATIHLMDEKIDNGNIIYQTEVQIYDHDTSKQVYERVVESEIILLKENFKDIIYGTYKTYEPKESGNLNLLADFKNLCKLDLEEKLTLRDAIDRLRALSHGEFKNAYFFDRNKNKIYVSLNLETSHEQKT